jgi:ribonuclease Z
MSLAEDIVDNLTGFSKAMYSTWFYYRPARILLDSGEGVSTTMDNFSFGIEQTFLSHGHYDHVGGLTGLVHARNSARGDKEKGLRVFYPAGDILIRSMREYIGRVCQKLTYDLAWEELEPGREVPLRVGGKGAFIRAFPTRHTRAASSLGYAIIEQRSKLKDELEGMAEEQIRAMVTQHGRDHVMQRYEKILLAYGGDSLAVKPELVANAEVLIHDATFLSAEDRDEPTHATSEEAIRVAVEANVKCLVLHHVSSRYTHDRVVKVIASQAEALAPELRVLVALGRSIRSTGKRT